MTRNYTSDASEEARDQQANPTIPWLFLATVFSISGALMGFLFAGHLSISAVAFTCLFLGILMGWCARGLAA